MLASYVFLLLFITSLALSSDAQQIPINSHSLDADNTANSKRVDITGAGMQVHLLRTAYKNGNGPGLPSILPSTRQLPKLEAGSNLSRFMMELMGHSMSMLGPRRSILMTSACRLRLTRLA